DYKTGQPKSRNEIEGLTKISTGDYKRQLVFYNLLLNYYQDGKFKMVAGEINFIEPDGRGNYKKELFDINPEEVAELEKQIKEVAKEILSLSFWDKTCNDSKCEYCKLRKMIK
ncbi:MAG: PD-(D/E)XK nuclease family protein, partial [Candidatus Nealsonbacteria bacterium]|nr:PD-(D/E)XK nuclease family protein [Candidatus Nealsonbacteria bacterium]